MSSIINTLFGTRKTPAERLRQHQRALQKAQRELDRERSKLEQQEKKLIAEIKKNAKDGQMSACKIQARDLVRTRRHIQKFYSMRTQLEAISLRIQTMRSTSQMSEAMKGATKAMGMMNRGMNLPQVMKIMREFEKESEVMEMKDEMMNDAVDEAMEGDDEGVGEEEAGDAILKEVLDGIGVDLSQNLAEAPSGSLNAPLAAPQRVAIGEEMGSGGGSANNQGSGGAGGAGSGHKSTGSLGGGGNGGGSGGAGVGGGGGGGGGGGTSDEDALQARLDQLRRG
ncbi:unnamed protein product [Jaminaea pallidilutea]